MFEGRFATSNDLGVKLTSVEFKSLYLEDSLSLIAGFSEEEVKEAMWQCDGSKSLGPDRFNINFIKSCWDTLKSDIMEAMLAFHKTGGFPKGCNASLISLIPKVHDPISLD